MSEGSEAHFHRASQPTARWRKAWCGLSVTLLGCASSFDVVDSNSSPGGGGQESATATNSGGLPPMQVATSTGGTSGASGTSGATPMEVPPATTPCGIVRRAEPTLLNREICIEGALFVMGSSEPLPVNTQGFALHAPEHDVMLSSFFVDAYEVTVARYRQCVTAGGCEVPAPGQALCTYTAAAGSSELSPITCVTWSEARAFCAWDESRRLPTEAEWEFTTRGEAGRRYAWGDTFDCGQAVIGSVDLCLEYATDTPRAVGSLALGASPEGVYDLTGNAAEWVLDWVGSYGSALATDPTGPATGGSKVVRGGSWRDPSAFAPAHLRRTFVPDSRGPMGFRCARDATDE